MMQMGVSRDVWIKNTDKDGNVFVSHHMVWDIGLFMASKEAEAKKQGGKVEQVLKPARKPK